MHSTNQFRSLSLLLLLLFAAPLANAVPPGERYVDWINAVVNGGIMGGSAAAVSYTNPGPNSHTSCTSTTHFSSGSYCVKISWEACPVEFPVFYKEIGNIVNYNSRTAIGYCLAAVDPPPVCDDGEYLDEETNECLVAPELCYTDVVTGEYMCLPMTPDENPEGCVTADGVQLCLGDIDETEHPDENCVIADGVLRCNQPDEICGVKNGTYQCVNPEQEGCGYFNGERICFDPSGKPVPPTSPDHPDNGGNLDGNENNDPNDPRPPEDGGDSNNQPNQPIDTTDSGRASEETLRKTLQEQQKIERNTKASADALKKLAETGIKTDNTEEISDAQADAIIQNGATGSWDDPATGTWAELDGFEQGISEDGGNAYGSDMLDGISGTTSGLISQGSCANLGFNFRGHVFSLDCDKTKKIRDLLSWVFYLLTVWFLFDVVTSPAVRRA